MSNQTSDTMGKTYFHIHLGLPIHSVLSSFAELGPTVALQQCIRCEPETHLSMGCQINLGMRWLDEQQGRRMQCPAKRLDGVIIVSFEGFSFGDANTRVPSLLQSYKTHRDGPGMVV